MKKILIVDDEPLILFSLAKALKGDGLEVKTVNNGSDAVEESRRCFYQLCFLDLRLPDMNGLDVMLKIKQHSPESKILVMSASCIDDATKELIEKNSYLFIPKPFELAYVKAITQQLMENGMAFPDSAAGTIPPVNEWRRIERTACFKAIMFRVNCPDDIEILYHNGYIVDVSKAGMGINTAYPVKPGSLISFDAIMDGIDYVAGFVRNTVLIDNNMFRAGIEFV